MLRGINKQQIFFDEQDCKKFIKTLIACKKISGFKLYAYCLMPNHIHLLLKAENEKELEIVFNNLIDFMETSNLNLRASSKKLLKQFINLKLCIFDKFNPEKEKQIEEEKKKKEEEEELKNKESKEKNENLNENKDKEEKKE